MDDKDVIIAEQRKLIARQAALIRQLQDELARLKKNSSNSSKPPCSDIVKPPKPKTKRKRKSGGQPGHKAYLRPPFPPDQVDKTIIHKLPAHEVQRRGLTPLKQTAVALQQVELPKRLFRVIEHRVRLYRTPNGQIVPARIPRAIRKSGFFTPRMHALAGYLKARCHMSYSTIRSFLSDVAGLDVSTGHLCNSCTRKIGPALQPAYSQAATEIRNAAIVGTDETGHNDAGQRGWTWCQRSEQAIRFHVDASRGSEVLKKMLGADFAGVVIADYFSANKKFVRDHHIPVQYCWAHLIRDIKSLAESRYRWVRRWAGELLGIVRRIFEVWHRRWDCPRWRTTLSKLRAAFLRKVRRPPDYADAVTLGKRFDRSGAKGYFLFLQVEGVTPTHNATERAIRHVVIDRRVTQGTRGWWGMRFCERAWTVVATCGLHDQSVFRFFHDALSASFRKSSYPVLISKNR